MSTEIGEVHTYETIGKRSDGSEFPIRVSLTCIEANSIALYVGFLTDLSEIKKIQEKLMNDANHDFLTGLFNRRFFEEQLKLELARHRRSGDSVSLIMMDIDHFKHVNDTYGHLAGDKVLAFLAAELSKQSRKGDVVGRFGGEEFLVLLPDTNQEKAVEIAERLRSRIEKLALIDNDMKIQFTVSIGVTTLPDTADASIEDFIKSADIAMYAAKNNGRNRVEVI